MLASWSACSEEFLNAEPIEKLCISTSLGMYVAFLGVLGESTDSGLLGIFVVFSHCPVSCGKADTSPARSFPGALYLVGSYKLPSKLLQYLQTGGGSLLGCYTYPREELLFFLSFNTLVKIATAVIEECLRLAMHLMQCCNLVTLLLWENPGLLTLSAQQALWQCWSSTCGWWLQQSRPSTCGTLLICRHVVLFTPFPQMSMWWP